MDFQFAEIDGIRTRYQVMGDGPPLLMYAPGGFDATIEKWGAMGVYKRIQLLNHLPKHFRCILFDRRECGQSGGRVERVTWNHFVAQGRGLLDHLGIDRAHVMGGCMGVPPVTAFGVAHPDRVLSMVLYFPVGGAAYRMNSHLRFARHLAYVDEHGLEGVVALLQSTTDSFSKDPRGGPWGAVVRNDPAFARAYAAMDPVKYKATVQGLVRTLFDRDTAPGPEPEDLMCLDIPTLVVPGADAAHGTSAARYLAECIPGAQYWDQPVEAQTEDTAPARILEFLGAVG